MGLNFIEIKYSFNRYDPFRFAPFEEQFAIDKKSL